MTTSHARGKQPKKIDDAARSAGPPAPMPPLPFQVASLDGETFTISANHRWPVPEKIKKAIRDFLARRGAPAPTKWWIITRPDESVYLRADDEHYDLEPLSELVKMVAHEIAAQAPMNPLPPPRRDVAAAHRVERPDRHRGRPRTKPRQPSP